MNRYYLNFQKKTKSLLHLLDFFHNLETVPQLIQFDYQDFYLKNIISNNYTNFENYLRESLSFIVSSLSNVIPLKSTILSEELRYDLVKKCMNKFPKNIDERMFRDSKKDLASQLYDMLNQDIFKIFPIDHSFTKLPHSTNEIEHLLRKYINQKCVLPKIKVQVLSSSILDDSIQETDAFSFLNNYIGDLRHPIVHQGLVVYMNQDMKIDYTYVKHSLEVFLIIVEKLSLEFEKYYQKIIEFDYNICEEKEESMVSN